MAPIRGLGAALALMVVGGVGLSGYRGAAASLSLAINQVDSSRFPATLTYVTAINSRGYPVLSLGNENFQVTEDGVPVANLQVSSAVDLEQPLAAVLTIDVSGSMSDSDLAQEKAAAIAFVNGLRPQDQVAVIAFSSEVRRLTGFSTDRDGVIAAIEGLQQGGNTALYDALFDSVDLTTKATAPRRIVVLMTDGMNTQSRAVLDDGLNLATKQGVAVYTIGLGEELDKNVLNRIARQTGANSLVAPSAEALRQAYDRIAAELRSQYVLSYTSPKPRGARDYRISVRVAAEGDQARAEISYRPAPAPPSITSISLKDGQTLESATPVTVEATSVAPITTVRLHVNGRLQAERSSAPYELSLDPKRLPAGRGEVAVSVVDSAGSETTQRLHVVIPTDVAGSMPAAGAETQPPSPMSGSPLSGLTGALSDRLSELAEGAAALVPPVGAWAQAALAGFADWGLPAITTVNEARSTIEGWWSAAADMVRANVGRLPYGGMAFAAGLAGFYEVRRLASALRAGLRRSECPSCGARFRHYRDGCPECLERERQRELEERGLEAVLVQNNLVAREPLTAAVQKSREARRPLEEVVLEDGLISAADLAKARYYLTHSMEIQTRMKDVLGERAARRMWPVAPRVLAVRGTALVLTLLSWGLTLPGLLG